MTQSRYPLETLEDSFKLPILNLIPTESNMISHRIRETGKSPSKQFIAVLEYPDCTREFDGKTWKIVDDKRIYRLENNTRFHNF